MKICSISKTDYSTLGGERQAWGLLIFYDQVLIRLVQNFPESANLVLYLSELVGELIFASSPRPSDT